MSRIETLPTFTGSNTTYEEFRDAYNLAQCVCFKKPFDNDQGGDAGDAGSISTGKKRKRSTPPSVIKHQESLKVMLDTFNAAALKDQASWCIENPGVLVASTKPADFLGSTCIQTGYCSFVLQDDSNHSVTKFTHRYVPQSILPIITSTSSNEDNDIFVAPPYWMFVGRNLTALPMKGRTEHTDSIQHDGTFHYQLAGRKTWTLRPTEELQANCDGRDVALMESYVHTVEEGDVFVINTRLWWHQTELPGNIVGGSGLSISFARDIYCDGRQPPADVPKEHMSSIDGAFAVASLPKGAILIAKEEDLPPTIGRTKDKAQANCKMIHVDHDDSSDDDSSDDEGGHTTALQTTKEIKEGDFFILLDTSTTCSDSDTEVAGRTNRV